MELDIIWYYLVAEMGIRRGWIRDRLLSYMRASVFDKSKNYRREVERRSEWKGIMHGYLQPITETRSYCTPRHSTAAIV